MFTVDDAHSTSYFFNRLGYIFLPDITHLYVCVVVILRAQWPAMAVNYVGQSHYLIIVPYLAFILGYWDTTWVDVCYHMGWYEWVNQSSYCAIPNFSQTWHLTVYWSP